ncbi:hypothetical protein KKH65_01485, partial [bacterium]|nr:hypothetical protein [bacterium]
ENLKPDEEALRKACTSEIFTQDKAIELVKGGVLFRDAYKLVDSLSYRLLDADGKVKATKEIDKIETPEIESALKKRSHIGGSGNLQLTRLREEILSKQKEISARRKGYEKKLSNLCETQDTSK